MKSAVLVFPGINRARDMGRALRLASGPERAMVGHGEGNYEADEETLKRLEGEGRVLYRYCSPEGVVDERSNVNGAAQSIAGIVNERGNVLGMMPHPENHVEDIMGCTDGRGLFAGLVAHLERAA